MTSNATGGPGGPARVLSLLALVCKTMEWGRFWRPFFFSLVNLFTRDEQLIPASFCTVGGLRHQRGGTESRFRGGGEEGGARFSISAAGGEGGCQLGWRAHAGLKPASRRCEREIFLRSLALALNFPCSPRSHRLPSTTMVVSTSRYCRRASEDVLSTHSFSKFLDKMAYLAKFGRCERGGGRFSISAAG